MKLTWWAKCLMAGALAASQVGDANAQQPGGGRGGRGGGGVFIGGGVNFGRGGGGGSNILSLADNEAVQKELGVSDGTKEEVKKINEAYREELQKAIEEATKNVNAKMAPQVKETLSAEQYKRLQEIRVQALRDQAYTDPEVVKALGLKKDQQEKIADIIKDAGEKQRGLFSGGGGGGGDGGRPDFTAMRAKMEEISKDRDAKINDTLTKDQQDKFAALKGKEFDLAQLQPRGFGGPGGGFPGGGGPGGPGGRPGAGGRPKAATPTVD